MAFSFFVSVSVSLLYFWVRLSDSEAPDHLENAGRDVVLRASRSYRLRPRPQHPWRGSEYLVDDDPGCRPVHDLFLWWSHGTPGASDASDRGTDPGCSRPGPGDAQEQGWA